jgi:hypothetical protein
LAVILPALFSSLVSVSVLGEGRSVQNIAGQSNSANTLSTLISEWESSAFEVSDDDIDDGISLVSITSGLEKYRFSTGKAIDAKAFTRQRANIIRGPPSLT